jgi:hypothetical protein
MLITQLGNLDLSLLPNGAALASALMQAWQDSIQSDNSYAAWGTDLESSCDPASATQDSNYQAAGGSDTNATQAKTTVASLWTPIATQYGLPTVSANSL